MGPSEGDGERVGLKSLGIPRDRILNEDCIFLWNGGSNILLTLRCSLSLISGLFKSLEYKIYTYKKGIRIDLIAAELRSVVSEEA